MRKNRREKSCSAERNRKTTTVRTAGLRESATRPAR
jgi:hypothetical protein